MQSITHRLLSSQFFWTGLTMILMVGAAAVIAGGLLSMSAPLVAAAVLAAIGCALILWQPFLGIMLFLGLMYARVEQFYPVVATMRLPMLLSCFTIFAWIVQLLMKRETFRWRPEIAWAGAFAFTIILSALQFPSVSYAVDTGQDAIKLALMFLLLVELMNSPQRLNLGMQCLLGFTAFLSIVATWGWLSGQALMEHGTARAVIKAGNFDDPNDLAAALVVPIPIALYQVLRGRSFAARLWGCATLGSLLVGMYVCNSRGGMLALGVALGVFLVYQLGWTRGLLLGAFALGLLFAFGPDRFAPETLSGGDDSALGRIDAWRAGLDMVRENPLFGVGYDQFRNHHVITAHNSLVLALGEGGLLNALCWVGMNYWAFLTLVRVRQAQREKPGGEFWVAQATVLQAGLLASLAAGMFLSHAYRPIPMIPIAFAAALGSLGLDGVRPRAVNWLHFALVPLLLAAGIGVIFLATVVMD